jgi:hypothetical protein
LPNQDFAGFVIPSRTESMRSRSRRSATRCSSDRRFSRNNILASSAARAQTGRWRAAMQALGIGSARRVRQAASHGRMRSCSGQARSAAIGNCGISQGRPNDDSNQWLYGHIRTAASWPPDAPLAWLRMSLEGREQPSMDTKGHGVLCIVAPTRAAGPSAPILNTPSAVSTLWPAHHRATNALASVASRK